MWNQWCVFPLFQFQPYKAHYITLLLLVHPASLSDSHSRRNTDPNKVRIMTRSSLLISLFVTPCLSIFLLFPLSILSLSTPPPPHPPSPSPPSLVGLLLHPTWYAGFPLVHFPCFALCVCVHSLRRMNVCVYVYVSEQYYCKHII